MQPSSGKEQKTLFSFFSKGATSKANEEPERKHIQSENAESSDEHPKKKKRKAPRTPSGPFVPSTTLMRTTSQALAASSQQTTGNNFTAVSSFSSRGVSRFGNGVSTLQKPSTSLASTPRVLPPPRMIRTEQDQNIEDALEAMEYGGALSAAPANPRSLLNTRVPFDRNSAYAQQVTESWQEIAERLADEENDNEADSVTLLNSSILVQDQAAAEAEALLAADRLSAEQKAALAMALNGESFFFTGAGGTGKSLLLRLIVSQLRRKYGGKAVHVTASTGVAACNIGGITLHSFAGVGLGKASKEELVSNIKQTRNKMTQRRWLDTRTLIVDEVSMLSAAFIEKLEYVARHVRNLPHLPWGGLQLILVGDFFQLPPIDGSFCFESRAWTCFVKKHIELKTVYRQTDPEFISLLNEIRWGQISPESIAKLNQCMQQQPDLSTGIEPTRLFPHRASVEDENLKRYRALPGQEHLYLAIDTGKKPVMSQLNNCPAPERLALKVNTQVMLLKNLDVSSRLYNGARGVVVDFVDDELTRRPYPLVKFAAGPEIIIRPENFSISIGGQEVASREQLPLDYAWAISIHKSQGLTLDQVEMSLAKVFECGQAYVALSRASSLRGLYLRDFRPSVIRAHPSAVAFYKRLSTLCDATPSEDPQVESTIPLARSSKPVVEEVEVRRPAVAITSHRDQGVTPAAPKSTSSNSVITIDLCSDASLDDFPPSSVAASGTTVSSPATPRSKGTKRKSSTVHSKYFPLETSPIVLTIDD